jgi:hypothetical protein
MKRRLFLSALGAALLVGCGKKADPAPDTASSGDATQVEDTSRPRGAGDDAVGLPGDAAAAGDASGDAEDESARRQRILATLATAELPGFTRSRGEVQGGFVTLTHQTKTANAAGNTVTVEATVSFCDACQAETKQDVENRKEQILTQYGELHAKNPSLVFDIAELALMPERTGVATYVKSYVSEGETRAAMHGLEVSFTDGTGVVRFFAYPQSPFPQSAEEHDAAMSRADLEGAVKAMFQGIWAVLSAAR